MKEFNLICAVALNGIIGNSEYNGMPWHLPSDLEKFKEITTGKTVVMGATTYKSIGRNLPNRKNVVLTRGNSVLTTQPDATHASFPDALRTEEAGFFVIGGQHIYREALKWDPLRLYLTVVHIDAEGDVTFPVRGSTLRYDHFLTSMGRTYVCESRSEMMNENGIDFEYTVFKLKS